MDVSFIIGKRLLVLAAVCLFGLFLSPPRKLLRIAAAPFTGAARKLNTARRSLKDRAYRGVIITGAILLFGYAIGATLQDATRLSGWGIVLEIAVLLMTINARLPLVAWQVYRHYGKDRKPSAATVLYQATGLETTRQEEHAFIRLAIDQTARLDLAFFWMVALAYLAAGLAGATILFLLAAVHAHGHTEAEENRTFYYSLDALLRLLEAIAGRIAGAWTALAGLFVPAIASRKGFAAIVHKNGGWMAVHAALLSLTLGGPRRVRGEKQDVPWVETGDSTVQAGPTELLRYALLQAASRSLLFLACFCGGVLLQSHRTATAFKEKLLAYWNLLI